MQIFDPIRIGDLELANRIVMAPLTRNRATGGVPTEQMARYYALRADPRTGAGLIISEGAPVSPMARGYLDTPGLYDTEQIRGWQRVTRAVHERGGRIVAQIWHVGRVSHVSLLPAQATPLAPSAIRARSRTYIRGGFAPVSGPRALATHELAGIVREFRTAARNAMEAGFDGVEIHGANGYLLDQFLRDGANRRDDAYGGPIAHRARLLLEVTRGVCAEIGNGRTGLRLSPVTPANDLRDSDPQPLFNHVCEQLAPLRLMYVHLIEGATGGRRDVPARPGEPFDYGALRTRVGGPWMVNNGYSRDMALRAVSSGAADLVAFGKAFIANPDLGRRLREALPWNRPDPRTFFGGGERGYLDYPVFPPRV